MMQERAHGIEEHVCEWSTTRTAWWGVLLEARGGDSSAYGCFDPAGCLAITRLCGFVVARKSCPTETSTRNVLTCRLGERLDEAVTGTAWVQWSSESS